MQNMQKASHLLMFCHRILGFGIFVEEWLPPPKKFNELLNFKFSFHNALPVVLIIMLAVHDFTRLGSRAFVCSVVYKVYSYYDFGKDIKK